MPGREKKRVSDSRTEQIQIVMPSHANGNGRLFGGQLVAWVDVVAAVVARRHAGYNVTTASIDHLQFKKAAFVNDTVLLDGRVTYVGMTSMEVRVDTYVEQLSGKKNLVNTAYLMMVALDDNGRPSIVPELLLETDEERAEYEAGVKRTELRLQRRLGGY